MGRFSYEDADKYGSNGNGGSYFKIEGDGEVKRVRLLGKDMNDFNGYACHEVKIGSDQKRRLVNCLREHGDPYSVCPLCNNRNRQLAKVFIPLYNIDEDEVQVWERGKTIFPILASYCKRHKNVFSYITEIERHGKPRDTNTTYSFWEAEEQSDEEVSLEDFEIPEILGRYILDKTAEDMEYFLDNGEFPDDDSDDSSNVVRRRTSNSDDDSRRRSTRRSRRREADEEF